jgi:acetyl esterase/lipase
VYLPIEKESGPGIDYPVVVLAHSWGAGKTDILLAETMRFVNQMGYAAVTIDYRDDDKSGNPWTAHNDGACALAWVYTNADTYGLDVDRMVAFGNSYGAVVLSDLTLADNPNVFVTDCPDSLPSTKPFRGAIAFSAGVFGVPGEGLSIPSQEWAAFHVHHLHAADTVEEMLAIHDALAKLPPTEWATSGELSQEAKAYAQTWPAYWVNSGDPPFLLLVPEQDLYSPQREYEAFARLLEDEGVSFTYLVLPDAKHTSWGPTGKIDPASWQEPIQQFLERVLAE